MEHNTIQIKNGLVRRLVNPFVESGSLKLNAGTIYKPRHNSASFKIWHLMMLSTENLSIVTAKEHEVDIHYSLAGNVFLLNDDDEEESVRGDIYNSEIESLYVGNPYIRFSFKNNNSKNIVDITEDIIRYNGLEPEYEVIGEFKDGKFISFMSYE